MGLIYMRTSPSGGIYIGKTVKAEPKRWIDHVREANDQRSENYNTILSKAIRKYGSDNFQSTILEDNIDNNILEQREKYWIRYYNSYYLDNPKGYNMTYGGEGHTTYDTNNFLTLFNEGHTISEISIITGAKTDTISAHLVNSGITHDEIQNNAIEHKRKTIHQYETIYELWQKGYSAKEIDMLLNRRKSCTDILRSYYNISIKEIQQRRGEQVTKRQSIPIIQYTLNGEFVKEWESASVAARELNFDNSTISKCIRGQKAQYKNYIWKKKGENND